MQSNNSNTGKFSITLLEDTIAVPNTGLSTNEDNLGSSSIIGAGLIVLLFAVIVIISSVVLSHKSHRVFATRGMTMKKCNRGCKKNGDDAEEDCNSDKSSNEFRITKRTRRVLGLFVFLFLILGLGTAIAKIQQESVISVNAESGSNVTANGNNINSGTNVKINPSDYATGEAITLTIKDANANVDTDELTKDAKLYTASQELTVGTDSTYGYALFAYTDSTALVNEEDNQYKLSSMPENGKDNKLLANTWGITMDLADDINDTTWSPLSGDKDNPNILKESNYVMNKDDIINVYYGAMINDEIPSGTYSTTINYIILSHTALDLCPVNSICYDDNGANSPTTMSDQTLTSTEIANKSVTLWASNFQRPGYGFAGWNTKSDGTGISYGPNETITVNDLTQGGLPLYAMWIAPAEANNGNKLTFQTTNLLDTTLIDGEILRNKPIGFVTALIDQRDNEVYAIAKLADGNYWMIENLRLGGEVAITLTPDTTNIADGTTFTLPATTDPTTTAWCTTNSSTCDDQSMLASNNTTNTTTNMTSSTLKSTDNTGIYSMGNYYNWYSATAGNGTYSTSTNNTSVTGDICPKGWRLAKGGNNQNTANNDFLALSEAVIGSKPANYDTDIFPYYTGTPEGTNASNSLRNYPNNIIYSGFALGSSLYYRGSFGRFWSSTANYSSSAYYLDLYSSYLRPGTDYSDKYDGFTARCVVGN